MKKDIAQLIITKLETGNYAGNINWERFRYCNAYVGDEVIVVCKDRTHKVMPVKSYATIVAFYDVSESTFYEVHKYSRTTSKQVTQIYNTFCTGCKRVFIP